MSELDKGLVTSAVTFACLIVFGYVTGDAVGKTEIMGFAGAIAGLIVWYYNEKHSSNLINDSSNDYEETESEIESEEDLINPDYYEEED